MEKLFEIFSTREISIIFWLTLIAIFSIVKATRSFLNVLKSFFTHKILIVFITLIIYCLLMHYILFENSFWNFGLLKDSTIWFISSAMVIFLNINKAKNTLYFRNLLIDNFKTVVILEFLLNFYTFSFVSEFIIVPIISFLYILNLFAENSAKTNPEHKLVATFLNYLLSFFGIFIFCYTLYKTFSDYSKLIEPNNLKSFLLPILLTTISIPYFYFLSLYINYEILFIRIRFMFHDRNKAWNIKKHIFLLANINLNKLERISNRLNKFDIYHNIELKEYIRELSNK